MKTLINVARYHMVDRLITIGLPWGVLAVAFLVNVVIFAVIVPETPQENYTGGVLAIYIFMLVLGAVTMTKSLPFAMALGISRRSYYFGTALLVGATGFVWGLVLTILNLVEGATGGWGLELHFFRVPWLLDGPWYLTWATSFVLLVLLFLYGMWYGLIYRRWNIPGMVVFVAAQVLALLAVLVALTLTKQWSAVGEFFTTVTAPGLTGLLAALAVVLGICGFTTIRRVTV